MSSALDMISQKRSRDEFERKLKKINKLKDLITELTKQRNRALSRKIKNEKTLKEIRSLNRTTETGSLRCLDCGSNHIGYVSGDKSYTFDITNVDMRNNILNSIEDKINAYQEETDDCNRKIQGYQRQLQEFLRVEDIDLRSVLLYKDDIIQASDADSRLIEIGNEIETLNASLRADSKKEYGDKAKKEDLRNKIFSYMNELYKEVDPTGTIVFNDLFSKKNSVYSGCEETEFYLAKLYALAKGLDHSYSIIMDYFRDGELSSVKEESVIQTFCELNNQKNFTATLKSEEMGKYKSLNGINGIDYSVNRESHILSASHVDELRSLLKTLMIEI